LSKEFESYIESGRKTLKQLNNYMETATRVKGMVDGFWRGAKVYVFGSVLEGKQTAMSDIDILIVMDGVSREETYKVEATVYKAIDAPVELHVASSEEFEHWHKRFIHRLKEVA